MYSLTFANVFGPIPPSAFVKTNVCKYFAALPGPALTPKSKTH